jgi:hypothetical protein
MTKIKQDHNKYTYPKLVLNKLKEMWDFTFVYTHWHLNQGNFSKNLSTYM